MKKRFIKTPLVGVQVHGAKDVGTRTVNLLMGEHAGEYVRGDIMDANAVIQAFDEIKGSVDTQLRNDLTTETNRAKASENTLASNIQAEATKRENDDNTIKDNLNAEVTRATAKENEIKAEVDVINGDSTTEGSFRKAIADVVGAAPEAYDTLKEIADKLSQNDDLHTAINDAIATKATTVALNEEVTRAKAAEAENKAEIAAEAARAKQAEAAITSDVTEKLAQKADNDILANYALKTELPTVPTKVSELQNDSEFIVKSVYDEKIAALEARIAALEAKHPEAAE